MVGDALMHAQQDFVAKKIREATEILVLHRSWDDCTMRFSMGNYIAIQDLGVPEEFLKRGKQNVYSLSASQANKSNNRSSLRAFCWHM